MSTPHRVLIIGGGFAGLSCAKELANDERFAVTLLDRQNHHLFQPLLYQVATASLSAPDIARSLRAILTRAENVSVILDEVTRIDPKGKTVYSAEKSYSYDSLVLAAGARTSYFGNDEWAKHTIGLKSLDDAAEIRSRVLSALEQAERSQDPEEQKKLMTVAIIGGGPTGVELAGAFSDLVRRALKTDFRKIDPAELRVVIIQSGDRLLKPFTEEHSAYTEERLKKLGVKVILGPRVDQVEEGRLHLNDGRWIEAHTLIWAAGVGASPLTKDFACPQDRGGRIQVYPDLSLPDYPEVFAAGDLVCLENIPGVAPAATQMGKHIGQSLLKGKRKPFKYRDKGMMAIIGKNAAIAEANGIDLKGFPAWLAWLFIHLAFLVGFRNKLSVLLSWAFNYLFDKPGARVFTTEPKEEKARTSARGSG